MVKKNVMSPTSNNNNTKDVTTWSLPEGAIARLGRGCEPDFKFSPDGKFIGIGTSLGLWIYDQETLAPIALWETARGMIGEIAFSPNGNSSGMLIIGNR